MIFYLNKNRIKHILAQYPNLFSFCYQHFAPVRNQELLVNEQTDLVIEGFPRSANTFAVVAFQLAQTKPVRIAHHLHVEAQILNGVKQGLPVCVLIRHPVDAIKSLLIRHPQTSIKWAFANYIQFYSNIMTVIPKCHIALFDEVIADYGKTINSINTKFGTEFDLFVHNDQHVKVVFTEIEKINNEIDKGYETHVARPSHFRIQAAKQVVIDESDTQVIAAIKLYEKYVKLAIHSS
jgi:hypothetical protein